MGQHRKVMPLTTDAILLGAWASLYRALGEGAVSVLDIGTGTGVLSLMMAQRYLSGDIKSSDRSMIHIEGVDLDTASADLAKYNFDASRWSANLKATVADFKALSAIRKPSSIDHIICNPPFFKNSLWSENDMKLRSRHEQGLTLAILVEGIDRLLSKDGFASIVLPFDRLAELLQILEAQRLFVHRQLLVKPSEEKAFNRLLLEFGKARIANPEMEALCMYKSKGLYSDTYKILTQDFYL